MAIDEFPEYVPGIGRCKACGIKKEVFGENYPECRDCLIKVGWKYIKPMHCSGGTCNCYAGITSLPKNHA